MRYKPHEYQKYTTEFIMSHPISAVFLEMGLGKTISTLSAVFDMCLDSFLIRKVLVIAPLRVARDTWPMEINKWDNLEGLTYSVVVGSEKERLDALNEDVFLYIINRENVDWLVNKSGFSFQDIDMVIVDELSSFKSGQTKRFKSLMKMRPYVKRIVGLSGTPSSNGLGDLWAEFKVLDLGERLEYYVTRFRNKYFKPDKCNGQIVYSYKALPGAEEQIYEKISDITISMKTCDYLQLPECTYNEIKVILSDDEKELYKKFKKDMIADVGDKEIDAVNAASLSSKLLQMANGAIYDEEKKVHYIHNHKLDALEDLIEAANGKPVLIAYWFKHDLERIQKRFDVRPIKSSEDIEDWNSGRIALGIIHPASAGHGLNLQYGGSTLVWFSLTWSLELYSQTNARLFRQGQKNNVVIHHLITKGTIDEAVMKALKQKDETQQSLMKAVKAELGGCDET